MSHTSQRRGLEKDEKHREIILLAMIPTQYEDIDGIRGAFKDLALTMARYKPDNWISRNFTEIIIPDLGPAQGLVEWLHRHWPETGRDLLLSAVGYLSTVVTAVYNDPEDVSALLADIRKNWLPRNREKGYPISIMLSGLPENVRQCCEANELTEHTYLQSLGFYGTVNDLPTEDELSIITMCGHGLISVARVRDLLKRIRSNEITPAEAARDIAKPCVCGIVNIARAESIFSRLASA